MLELSGRFLVAGLVWLTFCRLALAAWQWPRVRDAGGLWPVLRGGIRIDLHMLALISAWPLLAAPWLGQQGWAVVVAGVWFNLWWFVLVLLEVCAPQFIEEYDARPNRMFIAYLNSPREVSSMLWRGYKAVLFGGTAILVLVCWAGYRWMSAHGIDLPLHWWQRALLFVVLFVGLFMAVRGTTGHRPLNAAQVAFSNDSMVNQLPLNSAYVVANAVIAMRSERAASAVYGKLPEARMHAIVRAAAGLPGEPVDPAQPSVHFQQASATPERPRNLVIIIEESLGAQFVGSLGGKPWTPCLDALGEQGWMLARAYATGTRSVRGLEAIATGFLPTPAEAVVKLPRSQRDFFTLAGLLGQHGYHSRFIYGGEAHFDNMKSFFLGNGFDEVVDMPRFAVKPGFVGSWGAADEDMFNELHHRLSQPSAQPTFHMAFSVSNHTPWEYPAGRIAPDGHPASVGNTVRYADWALGRFFEQAKASPYWEDTVFLVVADHDARVRGASLVPVRHFHIPAVILGAGVPVRRDEQLISQIDLAPTLLSLMGVSSWHPMLGADLTVRRPGRAIMQYGDNFGLLTAQDSLLVLEPHKSAAQFAYDRATEKLSPQAVDGELAEQALATALWPSWAYLQQAYRVPPQRPPSAS